MVVSRNCVPEGIQYTMHNVKIKKKLESEITNEFEVPTLLVSNNIFVHLLPGDADVGPSSQRTRQIPMEKLIQAKIFRKNQFILRTKFK